MTNLAVIEEGEQLPAYLKDFQGPTGAEGIDSDDLTIPRIYLAQALTPAVKDGKVKEGDLFLNLTEEALTENVGDPLLIVPLIRSKEYLLWRDRNDNGGGVMARAVLESDGLYHWDKPNQEFETKYGKPPKKVVYKTTPAAFSSADKEGLHCWGTAFPEDPDSPPAAQTHHNYIVYLPDHDMVAGMSLSRTQVKRARDFNAMLKLKGHVPIYSRVFAVQSEDDKSDSGSFKNYRFRPVGFVDDKTFENNKALVESFANINVKFDESHEAADEDEEPF